MWVLFWGRLCLTGKQLVSETLFSAKMDEETLVLINPQDTAGQLSNHEILLGQPIPAEQRVLLFSPEQWEEFVEEFAYALQEKYVAVRRPSGPRDKGRDVIGFYGEPNSGCEWDNYQCKHYDNPLQPNEAFPELGKLCYYTFNGSYSVPKTYYFVAPKDLGPTLSAKLLNPAGVKKELIDRWDDWCAKKITKNADIKLEGPLREWVEKFDFGIVKELPLKKVLERHSQTRFHARRFGNGLCKPRPEPPLPPETVAGAETRYVAQLLAAYAEHTGTSLITVGDLDGKAELQEHLKRQRRDFYSAEALKAFSRDIMPNEQVFLSFQDEIYGAVIDTCNGPCADGLERVNKTTQVARNLPFESHALVPYMRPRDKAGVCHQLANDDRLTWVK